MDIPNMATKTVETRYGKTEIEVVECDSCGTEIAESDATEFTLGDRHGHACDYCTENGPASFPDRAREYFRDFDRILAIVSTAVFPVFIMMAADPDESAVPIYYLYGFLAAVFWTMVLLGAAIEGGVV